MNCDDSRIYLPAYLDDELDVAESLRVQKHLVECGNCRHVQDEQLALRSALRDSELFAHPSADFSKRIEEAVRKAAREGEFTASLTNRSPVPSPKPIVFTYASNFGQVDSAPFSSTFAERSGS